MPRRKIFEVIDSTGDAGVSEKRGVSIVWYTLSSSGRQSNTIRAKSHNR